MRKKLLFCFFLSLLRQETQAQAFLWEHLAWQGSSNATTASFITPITDSTFIIDGFRADDNDAPYLKLHKDGTVYWTKYSGRIGYGENNIVPTSDGGFIFTATRPTPHPIPKDIYLQKMDANGDTIWSISYPTPLYDDYPSKLLVMPDGDFVLTGYSRYTILPNIKAHYFLMRTDSLGNLRWRKLYAGNINAYAADVTINKKGNFILSGYAGLNSPNYVQFKPYLIETTSTGDSIRAAFVPINPDSSIMEFSVQIWNNIIQTYDGNYVFSGIYDSAQAQLGFVAKVDTSFKLVWRYLFPKQSTRSILVTRVTEMPDSSLLFLASNELNMDRDFHIVSLSKDGQLVRKQTYTSTACSQLRIYGWSILPDSTAIVTAKCYSSRQAYLARVDLRPQRLSGLPEGLPQRPYLGQSYPNPANTEATIEYTLPAGTAKAELEFREVVTGRVLKRIALGTEGKATVDLSAFSSGMYIYTLTADGKPVATKKMVVVK